MSAAFFVPRKGVIYWVERICKETLDEAPFAYRAIDEITEVIGETVRIDKAIRPIYSYKDE